MAQNRLTLVEWMCKHNVSYLHKPLSVAIAIAIDSQQDNEQEIQTGKKGEA